MAAEVVKRSKRIKSRAPHFLPLENRAAPNTLTMESIRLLLGVIVAGVICLLGLVLMAEADFTPAETEADVMALRIPMDVYGDGTILERGLELAKAPGQSASASMPFRVRRDEVGAGSMMIYVDLAKGAIATLDNTDGDFSGSDFMLFDADMKRVKKMRHVSKAKKYQLVAA